MSGNGTKLSTGAAAMRTIRWQLRPDGKGGYVGTIELPLMPSAPGASPAVATITAQAGTAATALGKAAELAKKIQDSPVLSALLPPQAAIALKAASALSKSAAVGKLAETARKFTGPGMKRLSSALGRIF